MNTTTPIVVLAACAGLASATTFNFSAYSNNSGNTAGINTTATLSADATSFTITLSNNSSQGVITKFYLESGSALAGLSNPTILNTTGIAFSQGANPGQPQGGIAAALGSWNGNFFAMGANAPSPHNGLNSGESISVKFSHNGTFSLVNLIDALNAGDIRMAQHYQGWINGQSEWLANDGNIAIVPLPAAAWAGLGTLAVMTGLRAARRRNRA